MNTQALIQSLHAVNLRLSEIQQDHAGNWSDEVREHAERAIAGDVYREPDGTWTRVDFDHIDWDASNTNNPAQLVMILRRFHVLGPLGAGYRATGDERYAKAARRYMETFLRDEPANEGWAPKSLDADTQYDIRVGVWLVALGEFRKSPSFDEPFVESILNAVRVYVNYLTTHVRPDRNIRFLHGEVLMLTGLRLASLPEAKAWLEQGREILNDAVRRQVLADGAHMEATPMYHGYMKDTVQWLWRLSKAMPELGIVASAERVAGMHDYLLSATRPDGVVISTHDGRYSPAVMKPTTAVLDARAAFRREAQLPDTLPDRCAAFPVAGQAYIRDDWTTGSAFLTFDATTKRSFHWHPCRNSITLFANGRALLVDPGYTFETPEFPKYGHRTAHHNTVNFNGGDQSHCPASLRTASAGDYSLVEGLYGGGYWPLTNMSHNGGTFGEHHRTLLWVRGRFGVVLDHISHTAVDGQKPTVESCWQLSEGPAVCDDAGRRVVTRHDHGNLLMMFPLTLPGSTIHKHEGERNPMRGWLPIEWGRQCIAAPLIRVVTPLHDPWHSDTATVLWPFAEADPPTVEASATGPDPVNDSRLAGAMLIRGPRGESDLVFWTRRLGYAIGQQHGLSTDASLVHLKLSAAGEVESGFFADGTFCRWQGQDVATRLTRMDRLSW